MLQVVQLKGQFTEIAVESEGRIVIQSTCTACGSSALVSVLDGTLQKWINGHRCGETPSKQIRTPPLERKEQTKQSGSRCMRVTTITG
jgi:hypothetical protein